MRSVLLTSALLLLLAITAGAATYHADATNGNDATGDGSELSPWQSLAKVRPLLAGGDTVVLHDGNYGPVEECQGPVADIFADWVTYKAAPGTTPEIDYVQLGQDGDSYTGPADLSGGYDAYLRLEGLHIKDGFQSYGARHWALVDCLVERLGPCDGSNANIEKTAVAWQAGRDILVQGCEITNTGTGLSSAGHDIRILGNHVHHGTNDGLRIAGCQNLLVEGNLIHDFDDGVRDSEANWSRHCVGIHIMLPGPETPGRQNRVTVFRNNVIYDCESQIVEINHGGTTRNALVVFENNIFGPGQTSMFTAVAPCDGLIFRNNTVVQFPGGRYFNRWLCDSYDLRISRDSTDVEIYNNILGSVDIEAGAEVRVLDWNLVRNPDGPAGVDSSRAFGRFTLLGADALLSDLAAFDGRLQPASPALNAGTRLFAPDPLFESDYEGTARDRRPDLGAFEQPDQNPPEETPPPSFPGAKTYFVDDFEDGHYKDVDPWLDGPGSQGLSWWQPEGSFKFYVANGPLLNRNTLCEPTGRPDSRRLAWIFSDQGRNWVDYEFEFDAFNDSVVQGGGPVVLALDEGNGYWLDLSSDHGRLIRFMTDAAGQPTVTELGRSAAISLPWQGSRHYKVTVAHAPAGITIAVDAGATGTNDFTYCDRDPTALERFASGGIGFHCDNGDQYPRIVYDNVAVSVSRFLDEQPPRIIRWELLENHGAAGEVPLPVDNDDIVSSLPGLRKFRVTFSEPVDPKTVTGGAIAILGLLTGDASSFVSDVSLSPDGTQLTVSLSAALADRNRYLLTIAPTVKDDAGNALAGNRDLALATLAGDLDGSGLVTSADVAAITATIGEPVTSQTARYDVNASGTITAIDLLAVRALLGHTLP